MKRQEKIFQLALQLIPNVGFKMWKELISEFNTATDLFTNLQELRHLKKYKDIYEYIIKKTFVEDAEALLLKHEKENIQVISFFDEEYPYRLKQIPNAPCFLYKNGNLDLNNKNFVAIIGTRSSSRDAEKLVKKVVEGLKNYNIVIVSGMAYGVDILAHKYSLVNEIDTLGIVAGDVKKIYPQYHRPVCREIIASGGAMISESPLGTVAENFLFPARNRIIAGCSDVVVVVEAGKKSGAIITANCANEYDREVFAIPGSIFAETSVGCNDLIKNNKAHLLTCAEDIVEMMNWEQDSCKKNLPKENNFENLDSDSRSIVETIKKYPEISLDEIFDKTNINSAKLSAILLELEMENIVETLPGDRYRLV